MPRSVDAYLPMAESRYLMRTVTKVLGAALLLAAGSSLCSAAQTNNTTTPVASFTQEEVKRYAGALAELQRLNQLVTTRAAALAPAQRAELDQQADEQRRTILQRYALDPNSFNAMSKAVETDPALSERVRQALMDTLLAK